MLARVQVQKLAGSHNKSASSSRPWHQASICTVSKRDVVVCGIVNDGTHTAINDRLGSWGTDVSLCIMVFPGN